MNLMPSQSKCPQCGLHHPPLKPGQRCTLAKETSPTGETIDFEVLFSPLKNICIAQISKRGIKNWRKLFSHIILEINNIVESYKE